MQKKKEKNLVVTNKQSKQGKKTQWKQQLITKDKKQHYSKTVSIKEKKNQRIITTPIKLKTKEEEIIAKNNEQKLIVYSQTKTLPSQNIKIRNLSSDQNDQLKKKYRQLIRQLANNLSKNGKIDPQSVKLIRSNDRLFYLLAPIFHRIYISQTSISVQKFKNLCEFEYFRMNPTDVKLMLQNTNFKMQTQFYQKNCIVTTSKSRPLFNKNFYQVNNPTMISKSNSKVAELSARLDNQINKNAARICKYRQALRQLFS